MGSTEGQTEKNCFNKITKWWKNDEWNEMTDEKLKPMKQTS